MLPEVPFGLCLRCLVSLGIDTKRSDEPAAPEGIALANARAEFDYEILERIGRGGMGVVYRARQRSLDRIVALKMIAMSESASQGALARFRREAEMAAKLDHPNIVTILEVGEFQANPYLAMQFVDGEDLAARILDVSLAPEARGAEAHKGQVKIAQLSAVLIQRRGLLAQVVQNLAQRRKVVIAQLRKCAPAAVFGGNRIALDPIAVDVEIEVFARLHGGVKVRYVDPGFQRRVFAPRGRNAHDQ